MPILDDFKVTCCVLTRNSAFLGNFLILAALNKESYLHPPSKLLYRCLATTDLLDGLVTQPLAATYWMSSYLLCGVSLLTLTALSMDTLLALLLGIRYRQIVTLKRTCIITATFWIFSVAAASFSFLHTRISFRYGIVVNFHAQ